MDAVPAGYQLGQHSESISSPGLQLVTTPLMFCRYFVEAPYTLLSRASGFVRMLVETNVNQVNCPHQKNKSQSS